ncbi:MAG: peptide deformylase [Thermoleophilia bacterium]
MGAAYGPTDRVRTLGDPVLKQETKSVAAGSEDLGALIETMFEIMHREQGIGLAAPQIGIQKRVMVWMHPETEERYVLLNPRIVERSEETLTAEEGCLSIPGHAMEVERAERVVVEGLDPSGRSITVEASGLMARVLQHEIDHLEGRLILDRTSKEERRRILRDIRLEMDR